jgi:SAM-dependent methyltransferase
MDNIEQADRKRFSSLAGNMKNHVDVEFLTDDRLLGFWLDDPVPGDQHDSFSIHFRGWVIGRDQPVVAVRVLRTDPLITAPLNSERVDVAERYRDIRWNPKCGFDLRIGLIGLSARADLLLEAIFDNDETAHFAKVVINRNVFYQGVPTVLNPIMVTGMARSGTTWLMRILTEHPAIVGYRQYPYESRVSTFNMLTLTHFADTHRFHSPHTAPSPLSYIHHNINDAHLSNVFEYIYFTNLINFAKCNIDTFYTYISDKYHQIKPFYFVEKYFKDYTQGYWVQDIVHELFPDSREIFLVRDMRDMICSALSFNTKRGWIDFGRDSFDDDGQYIKGIGRAATLFLERWKSKESVAYLVKYEDLILNPEKTLKVLLEYLHLDNSDKIIKDMLEAALTDDSEMDYHRTTETPLASIGRWKRDLSPHLHELTQNVFKHVLEAYNYRIDNNRTNSILCSPLTGKPHLTTERIIDSKDIIIGYNINMTIDISYYFKHYPYITLYKCNDTGYRFYHPMDIIGNGVFYESLQHSPCYYQPLKWEHGLAEQYISVTDTVLEIGCGRGDFLALLQEKGSQCVGIEMNHDAVADARKKGISVYDGPLHNYAEDYEEILDVVCAFQVLEHIADPAKFIRNSLHTLKPGGKLILSVPNNDAYIKHMEYDLLNMPPHHQGLWNRESLYNIQCFFDMKLLKIFREPLQEEFQLMNYADVLLARTDIRNNLKAVPKDKILRFLSKTRQFLSGDSILAIYVKDEIKEK